MTVNWRENVEFCYVLIMLISAIVGFFDFYNRAGIVTAIEGVVALIVFFAVSGFAAFETDWAIREWDKLGKKAGKE